MSSTSTTPPHPPPNTLHARLDALDAARLQGMRRGVEKESLRTQSDGRLALTPHPPALGSPLTHARITTDFSESQLEFVTGTHARAQDCIQELTEIHQFTYRTMRELGPEMLWVASMPCGLPVDETIPLARFGTSNTGRVKSVYRMGLGHRYGRRMQTISGIHYNWSMPGLGNDEYLALIRNFRRHAFLLLYLFGASPAICSCFVAGRHHGMQRLSADTYYQPHATSLRMGRLGYQSDAQASLRVSYNSLQGYMQSLHSALTTPWPAYEAIGIRNPGGEYNQLSTALLQIENEFYATIRPKRVIHRGERPLHALHERGIQYVEVRCMDLDPFEPVGISAQTMRFLDIFLLHCLLQDSPPDTPQEIAECAHNQQLMASRGREYGLRLLRCGDEVTMEEWASDILQGCAPIAMRLDQVFGGDDYRQAMQAATAALSNPGGLPSAQVLTVMNARFDNSFPAFVRHQSRQTQERLLALPWSQHQQQLAEQQAAESVQAQLDLEAQDTMPFEQYRQRYVSAEMV